MPSWFFASIGAAIALQIAVLASASRSRQVWPGCSWRAFGSSTESGWAGLVSRVVLRTGTLASASYAVAAVAAILGAFDEQWWLVALSSIAGGALYALNGRHWLHAYRAEPAVHAPGESLTWLALLTAAALAGLALLLLGH